MAEVVGLKVQVDGSNAVQSIGSIKKELKEANLALIEAQKNFGDYSAEAVAAAKKVAGLKDSIQEAKETADLFDPGKKFQALTGVLTSVAGGFSAVQGALGLVGAEGKDLEKTLVKVQSALALSQGLSTIKDSGKDFARLKTIAVDTFKSIKTAIGSVGIGALVIAVAALVAYWDEIKAAITGVSSEQEKLLKDSEKNVKAEKEKLDTIGGQENILKLQGKSERDILKIKVAQTDQVIKATEENIKQQKIIVKAQLEAEKRNKAILKGILEFITAPLQLLIDGVAKVANIFGAGFEFNIAESIAGAVFDPKEVEDKGAETLKELDKQLGDLKNQRAGFQLQIQQIDKAASDKALANQKDALDKQKKLLDDRLQYEKEINESVKKLVEDRIKFVEGREKQFNDNKERTTKALESRINGAVTSSLTERINIANQLQLSEKDRQISLVRAELNERLKLVQGNAFLEAQLRAEYKKKEEEIERASAEVKLGIISNALSTVADAVGRNTIAGKALAVAQAGIDTYAGANKALATYPPPFGAIAAGTVVLAGLMNVRKILATKLPKVPGSSVSDSVSAPSITAPIAPSTPQAQLTQLDSATINRLGSASNRAYVLESDVTNSQERITRINRAARLG